MKRLVALVLTADGQVNDSAAADVIAGLSRADLKKFLAALRTEMKKRIVVVAVAGKPGPTMEEVVAAAYPGRRLDVETDESLGAGVKVQRR